MTRIKQHLITGGLVLGTLVAPALAMADATASPVATPTPLAWYQKVTVGGYLDAYYQVDLNRPSDNQTSSVEPLAYRSYDNTINQFTFGGGELTLKQNDAASGTGYFVDLLMGSISGPYGNTGGMDGLSVGQAYVTQTLGNATFTFGKFGTPIGYEVTYLPSNANFSRSLLYSQEPTFSTGMRLDYNLPAGFVLSGFADDGPSQDNIGSATGRGYGGVLAYSGIKNLSLTGVYYYQDDILNPGPGATSMDETNGIVTYAPMDSLSFAGEYLNETSIAPGMYTQSQGYALYSTYNTPVANLSLSPRFEQWFNPNTGSVDGYPTLNVPDGTETPGATYFGPTAPYQLNDYTLTLKYVMGPLSHILEYRCDASNRYEFLTGNVPNNNTKPDFTQLQETITYAAIYSF